MRSLSIRTLFVVAAGGRVEILVMHLHPVPLLVELTQAKFLQHFLRSERLGGVAGV